MLLKTFLIKPHENSLCEEEEKEQDLLKDSVKTLIEMGFEERHWRHALERTNGVLLEALDILVSKGSILGGLEMRRESEGSEEESQMEVDWKEEEKEFVDLELDVNKLLFKDISEEDIKENWILEFFRYIFDSLNNVLQYCWICRNKLPITPTKITWWGKELWEFSFEESQGIFITPEIRKNPEAFSLDLSILAESVMGCRAGKTFEPFPSFFLLNQELRGKRGYLDNIKKARERGGEAREVLEKNKDIKQIRTLFNYIPSIKRNLAKCNNDEALILKLEEQAKDYEKAQSVYKLLQYITCTNRVNFRKLEGDGKLNSSNTFDEYILYDNEVSRENIFQKLKKKKGSIFTFHGSSIENWYSILRNGPRNLSNTKMMTAGNAYGSGIYSSTDFSIASRYSASAGRRNTEGYFNKGPGWKNSIIKNKWIIGVLEVIKRKRYNKSNNYQITVWPDDDWIMVRYIWIWDNYFEKKTYDSNSLGFEYAYYNKVHQIKEEMKLERSKRLKIARERAQK